jgi:hypothetical protein
LSTLAGEKVGVFMTWHDGDRAEAMMKALSKAEFDQWIAAYPRKLEVNVCVTVEPPLITWNDFERAPYWPDSIVARHVEGDSTYAVLEDINAPVVTKRKPDQSET